MAQTPPLATLTAPLLTDPIRALVDGAFQRGRPMTFAYVDDNGQPNLSLRGTVQTFGPFSLALWVRNRDGGLLKALERHPAVVALYSELDWAHPEARAFLTFRGHARVDESPEVRQRVFESSPEREQASDPDRKGAALIVELDSVHGLMPGFRVAMLR